MENQINSVKPPQSEADRVRPVKLLRSKFNGVNPKNKNPFFVGGIIIIIIILVATGLTVWKYYKEISNLNNQGFEIVNFSASKKTKTADDVSNWKIYRNEEYGFEIKYPQDWPLDDKNINMIVIGKVSWEPGPGAIFINIENKTIQELIYRLKDNENIIQKAVLFNKMKATEVSYKGAFAGEEHVDLLIKKENYVYDIGYIRGDKDLNKKINQMLSTFKFIKQDKEILSSENVYFSKEKQGKITLYSPEMKIDENKSIWCGGPVVGSKKYQGNFYLSFENSELNIGEMNFIEDSRNDGKLWIKKLNPKNNQDFIVILQYGSCNHNEAKFYGYNFEQEKLVQYKFKKKSGEIWNEIYVGPTDDFLKILSSKNFSSTLNDGLMWRFNDEENIFEEVGN